PALAHCWDLLKVEKKPRRGGIHGEKASSSFILSSSSSSPRRVKQLKVSRTMTLHTPMGQDPSDE
ncbi:hypothetical protein Taro_022352, partial [Colocasia esculenta]|nr:hypothetical protein [Colocasia esculenta]